MSRDDALREALALAGAQDDLDAAGMAAQRGDRRVDVNRPAHARGEAFHVFAAAAGDGAPLRTRAQLQQAMVAAEREKAGGGEIEDRAERARPDRGRHWQQM